MIHTYNQEHQPICRERNILHFPFSILHSIRFLLFFFILHSPFSIFHSSSILHSQQLQLDNLKEQFSKDKIFRINGGISANAVYYDGSNTTRDPFNWILSGNVNFSFFNQINLPFSFNINNLGANYTYPTMPNRFSIHPTYKWIAGHIGDVSMSFSPYTLGGHQFTGAGIELTPKKIPVRFSAMYGRMLKATPYNPENPLAGTAYKRMGYGARVQYEKDSYALGMTWFGAKDEPSSLAWKPDSLLIYPKNNQAFSWNGALKIISNLTLTGEYGISILTRDSRMPESGSAFFDKLFHKTESTATYHAFNINLSYRFLKNMISVGYERIDPDYQTLGAYYFTNDLENITLNFARPFFNDKVTLSVNGGIQRDDLDKSKESKTKRFVGAVNVNAAPNENLNITASYSGFQTYTNIKSQFDYINEITIYDNLDTLDFTQLSQNATAAVNYGFGKNENRRHTLGFNLNFQEAADKENDIIRTGSVSRFYNFASTYGLLFVPLGLQITTSANVTYNTIGFDKSLTCGPTLGMMASLFEKKLTTGVATSYNVSTSNGNATGNILNLRWNMSYIFWKRNTFSLILISQRREVKERDTTKDFTATCTYAYRF
ncbi:MAG: hypothetical protein LBQ60_14785 [Bacteroidales bacterium]|nr:hypothetical protein [Bacteroidales bacterium]